jgi:hypothetical protein
MLICNCGATPTHFVKQFLDRSKIVGVACVNMVPIEISAKYWNLYMQPPSMYTINLSLSKLNTCLAYNLTKCEMYFCILKNMKA